jgi:hypothetical protein
MEVWDNRRVIAALEAAAQRSEQKVKSNRTPAVVFVLVLVLLELVVLLLQEIWF